MVTQGRSGFKRFALPGKIHRHDEGKRLTWLASWLRGGLRLRFERGPIYREGAPYGTEEVGGRNHFGPSATSGRSGRVRLRERG